ncbi:MAG: hypothetical protein QOK28_3453 [Actinomycetota bacterium]|jgi:hypothetical protein
MNTRTIRVVALLAACALVGAGCSKPKSDKVEASSPDTTVNLDSSSTTAPLTPGTTVAANGPKSAGAKKSALSGGDDAQAKAIGAQLKPQTTTRGPKPYYQGVGDDTIQLDFSTDPTNCGVAVVNAITAAGGALPSPTRFYRAAPKTTTKATAEINEAINVMVAYWNRHGWDAANYAPEIRKLMGDDPKNQYFGRHFNANIIDGGSNQCPEKTKAGATKAAEVDKAFAVFNNLEGASPAGAYNMAADLNAEDGGNGACKTGVRGCKRPMHFGSLWLSDQDYSRFAPFAWTQFATGSTIVRQEASYVCGTLVGKKASRSPDGNLKDKTRVFGIVHTNNEQDVRLANEFKSDLNHYCGKDVIGNRDYSYDGTNFGKAQQDGSNLIVQMKVAGVTSALMLTEPIGPLFQLNAAKGQNYSPEWIWSSFGYSDSSTVQRLYDDDEVQGSFGTSNLGVPGGFGFGAGDPFLMYHDTHKVAPDGKPCDPRTDVGMNHGESDGDATSTNHPNSDFCKAPGALVTWYYSMLDFIGGVLFAGPDLTPQNLTNGLQHYPVTRYGGNGPTSDPRPALVGAGTGKFGFVVDAVEWRWHQEYTSPPPESKAEGWIEYPDCQRHYLEWPNGLAPNWEKDGPNYNAWCSTNKDPYGHNAPGYGKTTPEDSAPPEP